MPIEPADKHASHSATWPLFSYQYLIFCICGSEAGEINGGKSCRRKIFYILFFVCILFTTAPIFIPWWCQPLFEAPFWFHTYCGLKSNQPASISFLAHESRQFCNTYSTLFYIYIYMCVGTSWDWNKLIWCKDVEQKVLETLSSSIMNSTFILYNEVNFHYRDATKWWWML